MSTWAVISVKQEDETYKSISVAKDGYIKNPGVGYMLSTYYPYLEAANRLVNLGNLDHLTSKLISSGTGILLTTQLSISDLIGYCIEKSIDYLYVFEDKKWKYREIKPSVRGTGFVLSELTTQETMEYADRNDVDIPTYCSFRTAVRWGDASLVILNKITEIDPDFDPYIDFYESEDNDEESPEFYQYYITDLSDDSAEWSKKVFPDLTLVFSELLDAWILCVSHYGTSWDYLYW